MSMSNSSSEAMQQRGVPTALPLALLALGAMVVFTAPLYLLLALLTAELIYLAIGGARGLLNVAVPIATFAAPLLLLSATMQVIVGGIDVAVLVVSMVRIAVLSLTAALSIKMLSIGRLIKDLSRFSPSMALSIAMGVRMLTLGLYVLHEVRGVYSINVAARCSSPRFRVGYIMLLANAVTRILILTALDIGESIYARYLRILQRSTINSSQLHWGCHLPATHGRQAPYRS